ncbi:ABC transporter substrate-binding protein [Roseiarcaceae bacterium H3SJ34-1]|uniref:ABC transporter substrate-binding protein n=1 Tax=Terripilifer ovatus TaxID=3032367 RepID=UPI003AB95950|nr:ABC transporter substrate-binding protein [Roseiarcaceae bacterium H3SJ34-1]
MLQGSLAAGLAAPFVLRSGASRAATTDIKFSLSAPFDGSNAAFFLGESRGWYREAGLNCQFDASGGSGEAVSRVGSGVYDLGVGDINAMMEFNVKNAASAIRCVYMLYYRSPLSAATLTKTGIAKAADLAGRKIGAAATDGAYRLFSPFAKAAGIDAGSIAWNMVGLQLREAVLARGDVEAILGFDSTMYFGLTKAGIKPDDMRFIYYSDAGLDLYGNGILVSQKMRSTNPDAVKRFVEVTARAWQAAAADPKAAIAALKSHVPLINAELEEEKLRWLIKNQLTTNESSADGLGGVRAERLASSLASVAAGYGLTSVPKPDEVFDAGFMPAAAVRKLPA